MKAGPFGYNYLRNAIATLNSFISFQYEMDRVFRQPKVHMIVSLSLPRKFFEESGHQSQSSAIFVINSKLFSMCLQQSSLNEQLLYDAGLAGLNFNFDLTSKGTYIVRDKLVCSVCEVVTFFVGLQLVVSGFSDKLPLFVQRVCSAIREYTPDEQTFIRVKELLRRELSGWETQQPYAHCAYFAGLVSESLQFPIQDMRAALGKVTLETQTGFLKNLFEGGSYGTALIVGNIDEVGAKRLLGIGTVYPSILLCDNETLKARYTQLSDLSLSLRCLPMREQQSASFFTLRESSERGFLETSQIHRMRTLPAPSTSSYRRDWLLTTCHSSC